MSDFVTRSLALLMVTCVFGCNPGNGIDPDKRLNELSQEELQTLCESTAEPLSDTLAGSYDLEAQCTGTALYLTTSHDECVTMRDACIERGLTSSPDDTSSDFEVDCENPDPVPATCDITVAQLEDCYDVWVAQIDERYGRIDCSLAGDSEAVAEIFDTTPPPACEPLQTRCASEDAMPGS
jgi:hypothetical protein